MLTATRPAVDLGDVRNVGAVTFGGGAIERLPALVAARRSQAAAAGADTRAVFLVDEYFSRGGDLVRRLGSETGDPVEFVSTREEPTTDDVDRLTARLRKDGVSAPATIVGVGGGITLDTAKAVANLLTNGGTAAQYQGWDLVRVPAVHKIGVPTISGTGAEASRTCVLTNPASGLKLGMNSTHTVFDRIVLDPDLTATVPRSQYFFTGMDAYLHSVEMLAGAHRHALGDAYAREAIRLCREVFLDGDMMAPAARERLMAASYLGGCAIAHGYVGVLHPLSAGLSVVLGLHHCVANCIAMRAMEPFYPDAVAEFRRMSAAQNVQAPPGVARDLPEARRHAIREAMLLHERPLTNALGRDFRAILSPERVGAMLDLL